MRRKTAISRPQLETKFPDITFCDNLPWQAITTLKVGKTALLLAEPQNDIGLAKLLSYCATNGIKTVIIGNGSNTIGLDTEFAGIVLRLSSTTFTKFSCGRNHVTAGAGLPLAELIEKSIKHGFGGLAELSGIPGTVGGALRMNAGAHGTTIGQFVSELCGFHLDGTVWTADEDEIEWSYRSNSIPNDVVITAVIFKLPLSTTTIETEKMRKFLQKRQKSNARGLTAGCAFKNISAQDTAGLLIDHAGCKGMQCGDAEISEQHGNFIVNRGQATEHDIMELMIQVRKKVIEQTGFYLTPEYCFANQQTKLQIVNSPQAPKVAVLKGGISNERSVSLASGHAVAKALSNCGYQVAEIDITELKITPTMCEADIVFPVLHGGFGENGELQYLLEQAKIPFIGCSSKAAALVFDKIQSKIVMAKANIPTPTWGVIAPNNPTLPSTLEFPVIVKPPREGSTLGIFLIESADKWDETLAEAFTFAPNELLVEQYISGIECTIGIINEIPLPMIEIIPPGKMYDFDAKYTHLNGDTQYLCPPANISAEQQQTAEGIAMQYYRATGASGILRVDFIITPDNQYYLLEGNNLPGFTASSLVPKAAATFGWSFEQLCAKLVDTALRR